MGTDNCKSDVVSLSALTPEQAEFALASTPLKNAEALMLLDWAINCTDPVSAAELLSLFKKRGGLDLLRAVLLGEAGEDT